MQKPSARRLGLSKKVPAPVFDVGVFDTSRLTNELAAEIAIGVFEAHLANPAADVEHVVGEMLPVKSLIEFVFSAVNEKTFVTIEHQILDVFPDELLMFNSSLPSRLLRRFPLYHHRLAGPHPQEVDSLRKSTEMSLSALEALLEVLSLDDHPSRSSARTSSAKNSKRDGRVYFMNSKPFSALHVEVPQSQAQAESLGAEILVSLKKTLQDYLYLLRSPEMREICREQYIPVNVSTLAQPASEAVSKNVVSNSETLGTSSGVSYLTLQNMSDLFDIGTANVFGVWPVLISKPAATDLRQKYKREPQLFSIAMRKLQELSHGPTFWTEDNHRRVNRNNQTDVPIYRAKLAGDARLIYQVDCIPDFVKEVDIQALRIFGIFTLAQMDKRLWDSVGYSLSGKGTDYKHRCDFRNQPVNGIIHPESFPRPLVSNSCGQMATLPTLYHDNLGALQQLLVLDKFYPFSQTLMNGILADIELSLMFQVSDFERKIIEHPSSCYVIGRSGTGKTTTMLFKMLHVEWLWQTFGDGMPKPRQLFITKSHVLADKVAEYFAQLQVAHSAATSSIDETREASARAGHTMHYMVDSDTVLDPHLPEKWSDLEDEHFPLFITFDQLFQLFKGDLMDTDANILKKPTAISLLHGKPITLSTFKVFYWPQFPQALKADLDPVFVFSEILAFSTLFKNQKARGEHDLADRTQALLDEWATKGLKGQRSIPGKLVNYLYVDEVQDNLIKDLLVLRSLCNNANGLFWAGDTAQTISPGSTFRFNDLRSLIYEAEREKLAPGVKLPTPEFFHLAVNYRSHAGIVNCAQTVIDVLTMFWSDSIDQLSGERGLVDGPKPTYYFNGFENSDKYKHFLFGDSTELVDFGAKQCILVRDDEAREKLRSQVGCNHDMGLIFTIYDSKGQEFDDVLLYNFFQDSAVDVSQWKIVLNAIALESILSGACPRAPDFVADKHNAVCHELKCLYVAVTRARKNLWIADSTDKAEPMRLLWSSRDQIKIQKIDSNSSLPHLAVDSNKDDWAAAGSDHFMNKRYEHARHCYHRASKTREANIAEAYYLWERAQQTSVEIQPEKSKARSNAFASAAAAFQKSALEAINLYNKVEAESFFCSAAQCYLECVDMENAAECYKRAEKFSDSARCYCQLGMFFKAQAIIKQCHHQNHVIDQNVLQDVALHYFEQGKDKIAIGLFSSDEAALQFMKKNNLTVQLSNLLENLGRLSEAAEICLKNADVIKAVTLLLKTGSILRASTYLVNTFWLNISFGIQPPTLDTAIKLGHPIAHKHERSRISDLKNVAEQSLDMISSPDTQQQIKMFLAILCNDSTHLWDISSTLISKQDPAFKIQALLVLSYLLKNGVDVSSAPLFQAAAVHNGEAVVTLRLLNFFIVNVMELAASSEKSCGEKDIQRLFSIHPNNTRGDFKILSGSFLHHAAIRSGLTSGRNRISADLRHSASIPRTDLIELLKRSLREHVQKCIFDNDGVFQATHMLAPCLSYSIFRECDAIPGHNFDISAACPLLHETVETLNVRSYHNSIRFHFIRILIFNRYFISGIAREPSVQLVAEKRKLVQQLYHVVVPSFLFAKQLPTLQAQSIPEFKTFVAVLGNWLQDLVVPCLIQERPLYHPVGLKRSSSWLTVAETTTIRFIICQNDMKNQISHDEAFAACSLDQLLRAWVPDHRNIVSKLLHALRTSGFLKLPYGVLYATHIIDHQLPVDLEILCELLEYLGLSYILLHRAGRSAPFHDVTHFRRTLMSWRRWDIGKYDPASQSDGYMSAFLASVHKLLNVLLSKQDIAHLFLGSSTLHPERNVSEFVGRICGMLALLGYNLPDNDIRNTIVSIFTSLKAYAHECLPSYSSYVTAQSWHDVVDAFKLHLISVPRAEETLHLLRDANSKLIHRGLSIQVQKIRFKKGQQIPSLLEAGNSRSVGTMHDGSSQKAVGSQSS